mmetsp:Transcript_39500/g.98494  ORF Transcript_39500/g.98494 Transcript_39500/m.98494 type:complete len:203 (-) Transcript_39500:197-805(-)
MRQDARARTQATRGHTQRPDGKRTPPRKVFNSSQGPGHSLTDRAVVSRVRTPRSWFVTTRGEACQPVDVRSLRTATPRWGVARQAQSRSATRGGQPRCARAAQDLGAAYHTLSCRKGSASLCRWRRRATGQHGALSSGQSGGCAPSSEPAPQSRLPSSEARDKLVHDLTKALALDKGGRGAVEVAGDGQVRSVGILEVLLRL